MPPRCNAMDSLAPAASRQGRLVLAARSCRSRTLAQCLPQSWTNAPAMDGFAHSRFGMENGFAMATELLPLPVGSEPRRNTAAPSVQSHDRTFLPTTELLRPCAPHRYSGPCGFCHLNVSLGSGTTGSHVPYKSLIRLRAASMPDVARAAFRTAPELIPEARRLLRF